MGPYHAAAVTKFGKRWYNTWLSNLSTFRIISENRCLNGRKLLFAESRVEEPLHATKVECYLCYLSVQVSINNSTPKRFHINCSIDLCYIKTAIPETLPLGTHNYENYVTFKVVQFTSQITSTSDKVEDGGATDMRLLIKVACYPGFQGQQTWNPSW